MASGVPHSFPGHRSTGSLCEACGGSRWTDGLGCWRCAPPPTRPPPPPSYGFQGHQTSGSIYGPCGVCGGLGCWRCAPPPAPGNVALKCGLLRSFQQSSGQSPAMPARSVSASVQQKPTEPPKGDVPCGQQKLAEPPKVSQSATSAPTDVGVAVPTPTPEACAEGKAVEPFERAARQDGRAAEHDEPWDAESIVSGIAPPQARLLKACVRGTLETCAFCIDRPFHLVLCVWFTALTKTRAGLTGCCGNDSTGSAGVDNGGVGA